MTAVGWLPADAGELFGPDATAEESYEILTVDVPPATWISALETARDRLGCTYFDWLSAVDEPGTGFRVTAHVAALSPLRRLLLRTTVPHEAPALPSAVGVYAGAAWHERETHEMFGVTFEGHPALDHLLLPENFEGHPLRKDFVLAARVAKAWPGAKEPGESEHGGPKRRQMLPPGVPDPNEWGPLKGQLPPAPARPARGAARAAGDRPPRTARPAGERPVRRTRTASEGSASQTTAGNAAAGDAVAGDAVAGGTATPSPTAPRRARSAAEGSASQAAAGTTGPESSAGDTGPSTVETGASTAEAAPSTPEAGASAAQAGDSTSSVGPRRARSASEGPASQRTRPDSPAGPRRARSASEGSASQRGASDQGDSDSDNGSDRRRDSQSVGAPRTPRSSDAPWHHARPAFDEPEPEPSPETPKTPKTSESPGTSESPAPENTRKPADDDPENPSGPTEPTDPTGGPR
ncbi:NADH-quinone oxidoreductase subunit C [Streptomyces sp. NPDC006251]|uniref:NADH-quinone oxidoreductase subunit C n=1 Tax=Streptomyces sp. NPDC006251 TaxID=3155718 RepID=UPI0033AF8F40